MPRSSRTVDSPSVSSPSKIVYHDLDSYIAALEAQNARLRRKLEHAQRGSRSITSRLLPSWAQGPLVMLVGTFLLLRVMGPDGIANRSARDEHISSILAGESTLAGNAGEKHDFWVGGDRDRSDFHDALSGHGDGSAYPFTLYPFGNLTLANLGFVFADPWSTLGIPADNVLHPLYRGEVSLTEWDEALEEAERRAEELAMPWEDEEACDASRGWYLPEACAFGRKRFRSAVDCLTDERCRAGFSRRFDEGGLGAKPVEQGTLLGLKRAAFTFAGRYHPMNLWKDW